ncbi:Hypothetical predicted protein [Olea europaea subsp. europaea]|uniref:Uncharacterized protein n=1 Tax=Olea europaea subsp. europaea TaxID=158383 RepID=A0A8S0RXW6_OLEEU|nr:Hypothetical predicted protein [Olea europaea subsp. europaea]
MMDMKDIEASSKSTSSTKSTVVEFDNDSMQITDPLYGAPPEFKITSVVGIEDEEVVKTIEQNGVQDLQLRNSLRVASSKSVSTKKITMVGFEEDLIQIKEELVGQSSRLKSFQSSEWEELATQHLQEIFTMIHLLSITSTFEPGQLYLRNIKCKNCL